MTIQDLKENGEIIIGAEIYLALCLVAIPLKTIQLLASIIVIVMDKTVQKMSIQAMKLLHKLKIQF